MLFFLLDALPSAFSIRLETPLRKAPYASPMCPPGPGCPRWSLPAAEPDARKTIDGGLKFLAEEAVAWKAERKVFVVPSRSHGDLTLNEAKRALLGGRQSRGRIDCLSSPRTTPRRSIRNSKSGKR